ncbi:MAG: (2Fe-2S)-binding protein [Alphaproteobacteria bacterium]
MTTLAREKKKADDSTLPPAERDEMICGCFDLTLGAYQDFLRANPGIGFDEMMWRTKAGTKCTACTLDLEYHYVATAREGVQPSDMKRAPVGIDRPVVAGKAALYKAIDSISPQVAQPFSNVMPILVGHGIDEFVCVDNHSLLYEHEICAPDMRVDLEVRDSEGRLRFHHEDVVKGEASLRINVSRHLPATSGTLGIGSVTIARQALKPGYRGTTRPQIEIVAPRAACALHSQAATRAPEGWFTCLHRSEDERIFLTLVNAGDRDLSMELAYPIIDGAPFTSKPEIHIVPVPPRGARLHEVTLPREQYAHLVDRPINIRWRAEGQYKVHVVCATPSLDRFSIDHL